MEMFESVVRKSQVISLRAYDDRICLYLDSSGSEKLVESIYLSIKFTFVLEMRSVLFK